MPTINYGKTDIHYCHYVQNRKDIKINVDLVNGVVVYTPDDIDQNKLDQILLQKAPWITQKLDELNEVNTSIEPKEFVSGEKLPYLGRHYRLKVWKEPVQYASIQLKQGRFTAVVPQGWTQDRIQQELEHKLIEWYRQYGHKKVLERAHYYETLLGVEPQSLQLRTQFKRWGSCTPKGDIYLNWRIVMAPIHVVDYVIVHELAHLIVPEHSKKFWHLVKSILPAYETSKEWLRVHGVELHNIG
ncbi:M48 family metallopeptidase [Salibacterium aidingense]|uniref:M48 family metallopeptidase n=1 Tax=Salibacterium aidingense TaxID=384933 RepID=UPI000415107A|nr:SprT family zinc-dependent metalloprotease [Salibacterium aidingense]